MSKFIQAILVGMVVVFILDFFLFLGLWQNFIRANEIDIFFNVMFVDNQNIYLLIAGVLFYGLMVMYSKSNIINITTLLASALLSLMPLISKDVALDTAKDIFMKQNVTLKVRGYIYSGDIYYKGRKNTYFYDNNEKLLVKIPNDKIESL